jgi:hypothetical protein
LFSNIFFQDGRPSLKPISLHTGTDSSAIYSQHALRTLNSQVTARIRTEKMLNSASTVEVSEHGT